MMDLHQKIEARHKLIIVYLHVMMFAFSRRMSITLHCTSSKFNSWRLNLDCSIVYRSLLESMFTSLDSNSLIMLWHFIPSVSSLGTSWNISLIFTVAYSTWVFSCIKFQGAVGDIVYSYISNTKIDTFLNLCFVQLWTWLQQFILYTESLSIGFTSW